MSRIEVRHVLAFNSGSSSLRFGLYRIQADEVEPLLDGRVEAIGQDDARIVTRRRGQSKAHAEAAPVADHRHAIVRIGELIDAAHLPAPDAIGHRVVHGGPELTRHCLIDDVVLRMLAAARVFAPLHVPPALAVIGFAREHFPGLPQVACLDTVFHAGMPEVARVLPLPRALRAEGIRRFGFHGLSCESIVRHLAADLPQRMVIAHLGNGASITAVHDGRSVDTSMGLTPAGGVPMGTRSGDLDPGVLIWLMREKNLDASGLEDLIDRRSGLLGISGIASDLRRLHQAAADDPDAALAIAIFCRAVAKQIAAMIATLDGIDLLVFTGGIGENDAQVRAAVCADLGWMGIRLDIDRNQRARGPGSGGDAIHDAIHDAASRCAVRVMVSMEDEEIARLTAALTHG